MDEGRGPEVRCRKSEAGRRTTDEGRWTKGRCILSSLVLAKQSSFFHRFLLSLKRSAPHWTSIPQDRDAGKRKKSIATRYFGLLNARRACFLLFSVLSTENNKINNLWVLCVSNERSEWAVKNIHSFSC